MHFSFRLLIVLVVLLKTFLLSANDTNIKCEDAILSSFYVPSEVKNDSFTIDRQLVAYIIELHSYTGIINGLVGKSNFSFAKDLLSLKKEDLIIDFGDGDGSALVGLYQSSKDFETQGNKWLKSNWQGAAAIEYTRFILSKMSEKQMSVKTLIKKLSKPFYDYAGRPLDLNFQRNSGYIDSFLESPVEVRPKALGISFSKTENSLVSKISSLSRMTGKLFEDIPWDEIPRYKLGVSYFGIFSYTSLLSKALFKAISHLEIGGRLYILGMKSFVTLETGEQVDIAEFLQKYTHGFNVYVRKIKDTSVIVIEKVSEDIQIPILEHQSNSGSEPPVFIYKMTNQLETIPQ
jgi:hypothetical protein